MSEWKKVKLGEISQYVNDKIAITATNESNYISTDSMLKDRGGIIAPESIPSDGKVTKYQSNDILVSNIRPYFKKIWFSNREGGCSNDVLVFRARKGIISRYLYYILSVDTFFEHMMAGANGTKMPRGNKKLILNYSFDLPPLPTQHRIATILSRYDSLIENYQKQIKLLEEAAQRLYKEWFVDLHFPGHENTKIVDGVPEGWEKNTINDVCTLITSGSTPSRNKNSYWEDGTIRWVKTKELLDSWILDTEEYITQEGYNNSSTKLFPANTILMAIYASPTLGRLGILSGECCCNQAALGLIADEKVISWQWLFWKLYELRDEFNAIARGAGQQNISGIVVKNKEIVIPAKRVIDGFTSVVSTMFEQQKNLQSQIRLLTEARDRLLPKLMSGEIAV